MLISLECQKGPEFVLGDFLQVLLAEDRLVAGLHDRLGFQHSCNSLVAGCRGKNLSKAQQCIVIFGCGHEDLVSADLATINRIRNRSGRSREFAHSIQEDPNREINRRSELRPAAEYLISAFWLRPPSACPLDEY
jgi:hypothetical protein